VVGSKSLCIYVDYSVISLRLDFRRSFLFCISRLISSQKNASPKKCSGNLKSDPPGAFQCILIFCQGFFVSDQVHVQSCQNLFPVCQTIGLADVGNVSDL
jgi:hypothetical protein